VSDQSTPEQSWVNIAYVFSRSP